MAIEDAAALEVLFSIWTPGTDSVEKRLELFNRLRLPRNNVTKLLSDAMFYLHEPDDKLLARLRRFWDGPLPSRKAIGWNSEIANFFFPYDIFDEAEKAMKYKDDPAGMPGDAVKYFW